MAVAEEIPECFALINNAGIWNFPSVLEVTEQQLQSVIEVNIKGIVWCCQAFVPKMRAGGGGRGIPFARKWCQERGDAP